MPNFVIELVLEIILLPDYLNKVNKKRAVNHIFAEEINVRYKNGEIDNIFIGPSVQGIYTTGNEDRK